MPDRPAPGIVPVEDIASRIIVLRGRRVILDSALASIYGVETRALNQAVKRNSERFPSDFRFQLSAAEVPASRSQIVILKPGRGYNIKFLPYAFTEHGALMAANFVRSALAVKMSIYVVRAFVQLRDIMSSNKELSRRLDQLERNVAQKLKTQDETIVQILTAIRQLSKTEQPRRRGIGFTANFDD